MAVRTSDRLIRNWMGDSRGRWEGNTLVVETTNFNDKVREQSLIAFSLGQSLELVERFTRTAEDAIDYQFTVTDPTITPGRGRPRFR